jgi:hypothetical protein
VPSDCAPAFPRGLAKRSPAERAVKLSHFARGEGGGEPLVGRLGLGDEHQAARVLVEPVDQPEPLLAAALRQVFAPVMNQRVDQRPRAMPHRRMDHQARLLVQRKQGLVLIDHLQRNRFALGLSAWFFRRRRMNRHRISGAQPVARLGPFWIRPKIDQPLLDQRLRMVARTLQNRGDRHVETLREERPHFLLVEESFGRCRGHGAIAI